MSNKLGDAKPRSIQDRLKINQNNNEPNIDIPSNIKIKWLNSLLKFIKNEDQLLLEYTDISMKEAMFIYSMVKSQTLENSALGFKNLYAPLWEAINKLDDKFVIDVSYRETKELIVYLTIEKIPRLGSFNNNSTTTNSNNDNAQATNSHNQSAYYSSYENQNYDYSAYENYQKWYASYYQSTSSTDANVNYQTGTTYPNYQSVTNYPNYQSGSTYHNYQTGSNYQNTNKEQTNQTGLSNQNKPLVYQDQNYQAWQAWYAYCQNYNQSNTQNVSQNISNSDTPPQDGQLKSPKTQTAQHKSLSNPPNELQKSPSKPSNTPQSESEKEISQFAHVRKEFIISCFERILKFTQDDDQMSVVFTGLKGLERDFVHHINHFVFSPQKADILFDGQCKILLRDLWISMNKMYNQFNIDIKERVSPINKALKDLKLIKEYKCGKQDSHKDDDEMKWKATAIPPLTNPMPPPKNPMPPPKNAMMPQTNAITNKPSIPSLLSIKVELPQNMSKISDKSLLKNNDITLKSAQPNKKVPLLDMPTNLKKQDINSPKAFDKTTKADEKGSNAKVDNSTLDQKPSKAGDPGSKESTENATAGHKISEDKKDTEETPKETKQTSPKPIKDVSSLLTKAIQFQSGGTMNMDDFATSKVNSVRDEEAAKKRLDYRKTKLVQAMQMTCVTKLDKAKRMMEIMGWEGGALGTRGEGIVEPIIPALHIKTGRGLGHVTEQIKGKKGDLQSRIRLLNIVRSFLETENRDEVEIVYEGGIAKKEAKFPRAAINSFNQRVLMGVSTETEARFVQDIVEIMLEKETLLIVMEMTSTKIKLIKKIVDPSKIPKPNKTIKKKLKAKAAIPDPATCPNNENKTQTPEKSDNDKSIDEPATSVFRERILSSILEFIDLDIETTEISLDKVLCKKEKRFSHVALNYFNRRHLLSLNGQKEMELVKQVVTAMKAKPNLILATEVNDKSIKFIKKKTVEPNNPTSKKKEKKKEKKKPYPDPSPNLKSEVMTEQEITNLAHDVNQINALLIGLPVNCSTNKAIRYYKFRIVFLKKLIEFLKREDNEKELIFEYILNTKLLNFIDLISSVVNKKDKLNLETPLETLLLQEVLSLVTKDFFLKISIHESLQKFTLHKMSFLTNIGSFPEQKQAAATTNKVSDSAQKFSKDNPTINSNKPAAPKPAITDKTSKENSSVKQRTNNNDAIRKGTIGFKSATPKSAIADKDSKDNSSVKQRTNDNDGINKKGTIDLTTKEIISNSSKKNQKPLSPEEFVVVISDDDDDDESEDSLTNSCGSSKTSEDSKIASQSTNSDNMKIKQEIKSNSWQKVNVDNKKETDINITHSFLKPKQVNAKLKNSSMKNTATNLNVTPVENLDDLPELNTSSDSEINEKVFDSSQSDFSTCSSKRTRTDSSNSNIQLRKVTKYNTELTNVCIVHKKYPAVNLSANDIVEVQSVISNAIDNADFLPMLKCHGFHKGCLVYGCNGDKTLYWLFNLLPKFKVQYCTTDIFVEKNSFKIALNIKTYFKEDLMKLFRRIELYNTEVKTDLWQVLDDKFHNGCRVIYLEVDEASMDYIKKSNFCISVGVDMAQFSILFN